MSSFTMGQLIKIILVVFVVSVVVYSLVMFFKDKVLGFFGNLPGGSNASGVILSIIK